MAEEEALGDVEQVRRALASLWSKELTWPELQEKLAFQDQKYQRDLVAHGYEMTALLGSAGQEKLKDKRDIHNLRIVTESAAKYSHIKDALAGQSIKIAEAEAGLFASEEQKSHEILRRLIKENEDRRQGKPVEPTIRAYTPDFYALETAEDKVRNMASKYPHDAIFASDVVVLEGKNILEKPKNEAAARAILEEIAGKEVRISLGATLVATVRSGETVIFKEGAVIYISLQPYSKENIEKYLSEFNEYQSVAGVIDYAHPAAQQLIAERPVRIEALALERRGEILENALCISNRPCYPSWPTTVLASLKRWSRP